MRFALPLALLLLVGLGCSLSDLWFLPIQPGITFINHPEPNLASEIKPFLDAGCSQQPGFSYITCPVKAEPFAAFGCTAIRTTTRLGALKPDLPIMQCTISTTDRSRSLPNVYIGGCLFSQYVRYIVYQDGKFRLISTAEEFKATYAPIESPEEALSYAAAMTGLGMEFGLKPGTYRYKTNQVEDTYAKASGDGYLVRLFQTLSCGCGPHTVSAVEVQVSRSGEVKQGERVPVYEDPKMDGVCVD